MDLITPLLVIGAIFLISQQRAMFTQAISKLELRIITLQETIEALGRLKHLLLSLSLCSGPLSLPFLCF